MRELRRKVLLPVFQLSELTTDDDPRALMRGIKQGKGHFALTYHYRIVWADHAGRRVFEEAGLKSGCRSRFHTVTDWEDLDRLFKEIIASSAQALMSINPPLSAIKGYVALALRHRLPSAFFVREGAEAGGLLA